MDCRAAPARRQRKRLEFAGFSRNSHGWRV